MPTTQFYFEAYTNTQVVIFCVVNFLVYALYAVSFGIAAFLMVRRKAVGTMWNLPLISFLFAMITCYVAVNTSYTFGMASIVIPQGNPVGSTITSTLRRMAILAKVSMSFALVCHLIGDLIIIWRCFLIWNRNKMVVILPIALLLASTGVGIACVYIDSFCYDCLWQSFGGAVNAIYYTYAVSFSTNMLVTCLTAGRIYYVARKGETVLGEDVTRRYNRILIMTLESGVLYSAALLVYLIAYKYGAYYGRSFTIALVVQISGIAPTLLFVRAYLISNSIREKSVPQIRNSKSMVLDLERETSKSEYTVTLSSETGSTTSDRTEPQKPTYGFGRVENSSAPPSYFPYRSVGKV